MGLEKVKSRVKQETEQKIKEKIKAARAEASKITGSARKRAKGEATLFKQKLDEELEQIKKRENASVNLEINKVNLDFRKRFMDQVFESAKEHLENMSDDKRTKHVKSLLKKANHEIKAAVVHCNKKDEKHVGEKYKIKHAEILGGLIAESKNGELRVDYSYETLTEDLKETLMPEISKILFEKK